MENFDDLWDFIQKIVISEKRKRALERPLNKYNSFSDDEKKKLVVFCHALPSKLLEEASSKSSKLFKTENPPDGSDLTGLSKEIWDKYISLKQTNEQFTNKLKLWDNLNKHLENKLSDGLFMAGSTLNGFGLQSSDVDLSLVTTTSTKFDRNACIVQLEKLKTLLQKDDTIHSTQLIKAQVPLIKFCEKKYNFNVDINYNITSNIQNTHLLYCYSQVDWRVKPLVTIVKTWAKLNGLLDAKYGSLSSYPLVLMVIHFLQVGVLPKILPSLQKCLKDKFDATVKCLDYFHSIDVPLDELYPKNKQSLGELLLQFFAYYEKFEFDKYVISIRKAEKILKSEYSNPYMDDYKSGFIFIEEPFNLSNVGQTVHKSVTFEKIKSKLEITHLRLKTKKNLSAIFIGV